MFLNRQESGDEQRCSGMRDEKLDVIKRQTAKTAKTPIFHYGVLA
jgi:hypothetical protein